MSNTIGFIHEEKFLLHTPPAGHPERPDRLRVLVTSLQQKDLWRKLAQIKSTSASEDDLVAVHAKEYVQFVKRTSESAGGVLDEGDTHVSRTSFDVALLACGGVMRAIDAVVTNNVSSAFCAVRPPGHHAERDRAMGFCLFNNVAVGARYAQRRHALKKIAILDWDVHHGNGTQHTFEDDPSVLFISLHQYPFYPGTGSRDERGIGKGIGFTLNIPLPAGTGEARYLQAFTDEVVPELMNYKPELLLISAGFDAHEADPLGGMKLTNESFAAMTTLVKDIAPVVSVLEGGYNLEALAGSVEAHLNALSAP